MKRLIPRYLLGIKIKLLGSFILFVLLIMWGSIYFATKGVEKSIINHESNQVLTTTQVTAKQIRFLFKRQESLLNELANHPDVRSMNIEHIKNHVLPRYNELRDDMDGFILYNKTGEVIAFNSSVKFNKAWQQSIYENSVKSQNIYLSGALSNNAGSKAYVMAVPVVNTKGSKIGILAGIVSANNPLIRELINNDLVKEEFQGGLSFIIDGNGEPFLLPKEISFRTENYNNLAIKDKGVIYRIKDLYKIRRIVSGKLITVTEEHEKLALEDNDNKSITFIVPIGYKNWYLGIEKTQHESEEYFHLFKTKIMYGTFLFLILALVLIWLLASRITAPILELVQGVRTVASGNLRARINIKKGDEVGELAKAFNFMTDSLQETMEQLHTRINQLTTLRDISNTLQSTMVIEKILHIVLTAVTSSFGLGYKRAFLFLVNDDEKTIQGKMASGGFSFVKYCSLEEFIEDYEEAVKDRREQKLNRLVSQIKIDLSDGNSLISRSIRTKAFIKIDDSNNIKEGNKELLDQLQLHKFIVVPLVVKDKAIGVLLVDELINNREINDEEINLLRLFTGQVALALENAKLYEDSNQLAITDGLTKLYNHRFFQEFLEGEVKRSNRYHHPVSLIMLDIDHFKHYNDTHGHPAGDIVLKNLAYLLLSETREIDIVARYGGEEFVIILPETTKQEAKEIAERIRDRVEAYEFPYQEQQPKGNITISVGVAAYPIDALNQESLIKNADTSLYKAKSEGRNKVVMAEAIIKG